MNSPDRLTRLSFSNLAAIEDPRPLTDLPGRVWTEKEWARIELGYAAQDMDEKWDIFAEDAVVFFHRSWTGFGMYAVTFSPVDGGRRITEAVTGSDPARGRYHRVMIELLVSGILLGEPAVELRAELTSVLSAGRGDVPAGAALHSRIGLRT